MVGSRSAGPLCLTHLNSISLESPEQAGCFGAALWGNGAPRLCCTTTARPICSGQGFAQYAHRGVAEMEVSQEVEHAGLTSPAGVCLNHTLFS